MSCAACQEQKAEVDLGCRHGYCRACLDYLGGSCRDGCTPTPQMPIEDARRILRDEESQLEAVELLASKRIAEAEQNLRDLIRTFRKAADSRYAKVKKAEFDLETLLTRPQIQVEKRFAVQEYAKVHFESDCVSDGMMTNFSLVLLDEDSRGGPFWAFKINSEIKITGIQLPKSMLEIIRDKRRVSLGLLVKNRTMLFLYTHQCSTCFLVDLEEHTVVIQRLEAFGRGLLHFKDKRVVCCPFPEGFRNCINNIAIRPHGDPDKFEIFDPNVGKLELVVVDKSRCQVRSSSHNSLAIDYPYRARFGLVNGHYISIPYLG